jgi:hypothetical protein
MALFGRRCAVRVDTLLIEGLDVRFAIEAAERTYGKAEIAIYNLNADHRQALEAAKSVDVELRAGYVDEDLTTIFEGALRESFSQLDPPDWITTIRSGDGDKAQAARISKSFPKGLSLSSVWGATVEEPATQSRPLLKAAVLRMEYNSYCRAERSRAQPGKS